MQSLEHALAQLGRLEPEVAADARALWLPLLQTDNWAQASPQRLTQRRLQRFCWIELAQGAVAPGMRPGTPWRQAQALAALLETLGMDRYAQIAGGETTKTILIAAEHSPERARGMARRAAERSGVEPPHTELITWATHEGGPAENRAINEVANTLELAVAAGDLVPGARGWRDRQGEVAITVLTTPRGDLNGNSLYREVLAERLAGWVRADASPTRSAMLAPLARRLVEPVEPLGSAVSRAVLRPLDWLLTEVDGGITLTAAGYLPPRMVVRAVDRLGWSTELIGPVTREADAYPVLVLRETATRLGLVRRRGNHLLLTPSGRAAIEDGDALVSVVASRLIGPEHSVSAAVWEVVLAALEAGHDVVESDLRDLVRGMVREAGWAASEQDDEPSESGAEAAAGDVPWLRTVLRELRWMELISATGPITARRLSARPGARDVFRMALRHRVLHRDGVRSG